MYKTLRLCILAALCLAVAAPSLASAQGNSQQAQDQLKLTLNQISAGSWPEVTLNMSLEGPGGKAVPDVQASQFEVREQGQPQALLALELGPAKSVPLALVMVMDVSGSMNAAGKIGQAKSAAGAFLDSIRPEDTASLIAFNDQVRTIVPPTNDRGA